MLRFPPFGGSKKRHDPLVRSIQKDQAEIAYQASGIRVCFFIGAETPAPFVLFLEHGFPVYIFQGIEDNKDYVQDVPDKKSAQGE